MSMSLFWFSFVLSIPHMSEILWFLSFSVSLISLSIINTLWVHLYRHKWQDFIPLYGQVIFHRAHAPPLPHPFICRGHLGRSDLEQESDVTSVAFWSPPCTPPPRADRFSTAISVNLGLPVLTTGLCPNSSRADAKRRLLVVVFLCSMVRSLCKPSP